MVVGEADRAWIRSQVVEPERPRIVDQRAEHAPAAREMPDRSLGLLVEAGHHEPLEGLSARIQHAERRIPRSRQLRRRLDDFLQHGVERQLGRERDTRIDERAETVGLRHGGINYPAVR